MMQKYIRCCITVVIIMVCSVPTQAAVNVLFMPESGFLRVEGSITMDPQTTRPSLLLFPNAQITMIWVDGLQDYKVDRGHWNNRYSYSSPHCFNTRAIIFLRRVYPANNGTANPDGP